MKPDHISLECAAAALVQFAAELDEPTRLVDHAARLRGVADWLRELVRIIGEQPVTGGAELDALRAGAQLAGVDMLSPPTLARGDVIQLDPCANPYGAMLAIVDEVRDWGVTCHWNHATGRNLPPAVIPYRAKHGSFTRIGPAEWRPAL